LRASRPHVRVGWRTLRHVRQPVGVVSM
jgi:hypothetical protein